MAMPTPVIRKLAAIVSTDVVGYSRLIGADEAGTLARMKAHRRELWDPEIERFGGRLVGTAGDSLLVEFASAVAAVEFAIALQRGMATREADEPKDRRMQLRIGVNVGEIVIDGEDILGDGVNVAARLEGVAQPDGIAISDDAYRQVRARLDIDWHDGGALELKNIAEPVRVWRWHPEGANETSPSMNTSTAKLPLPDKPSIAVLPFDNMSSDTEQDYFAQGIAEDIITGLSRNRWLFVIARNSSFVYAGKAVDVRQVGRELGVRYVLEGSVRRGGDRVRVNAQLIETETAHHVWADHYEGKLEDIFTLQDDITTRILGALGPELTSAEIGRSQQSRARNFTAWDYYLQAISHFQQHTATGFDEAVLLLKKAIDLDPEFSNAFALLSTCHSNAAYQGWLPVQQAVARAIEYGLKAVALEPQNPIALTSLGWAYAVFGPQERVIHFLQRALEFDPNSSKAWSALGVALGFKGESKQAFQAVENASRGSPRDPMRWQWFAAKATAYFADNNLEKTLETAEIASEMQPNFYGAYTFVAASAAHLGRMEKAREAVANLLRVMPRFSMQGVERNPIFERPEDARRMIEGLRLAGVPEEPLSDG
jgi:adenylate cyclase